VVQVLSLLSESQLSISLGLKPVGRHVALEADLQTLKALPGFLEVYWMMQLDCLQKIVVVSSKNLPHLRVLC